MQEQFTYKMHLDIIFRYNRNTYLLLLILLPLVNSNYSMYTIYVRHLYFVPIGDIFKYSDSLFRFAFGQQPRRRFRYEAGMIEHSLIFYF